MDNHVYYLSTCDTCKKVLDKFQARLGSFRMTDLKKQHITAHELDALFAQTQSYDALLNKRSKQIKLQGIDDKNLGEEAKRELILSHYSLLARPIFVLNNEVYIGGSEKTLAKLETALVQV